MSEKMARVTGRIMVCAAVLLAIGALKAAVVDVSAIGAILKGVSAVGLLISGALILTGAYSTASEESEES